MKELSPLQKERLNYQPKLPETLANGIKKLAVEEGEATHSVANQDEIKELFKNSYGMPVLKFVATNSEQEAPVRNVGVILSGGQAPGGI